MDWNYILSLKPEEIADETKDELINTIAWYDYEIEEIDLQKSSALLKISQVIMRYKSEQVEALVAELDELATKEAEEEIRKESEVDTKSLRSKRSTSIDTDDFEEKYREMKAKLRSQAKTNEKQSKELNKLKQHIKLLEQERTHLQSELQTLQQDEVQSDISETIKDQHKELIDSVRQKNKQITNLLNDIEIVEKENFVLKEQLINVTDELSDATKQLTKLTNELTACEITIEEKSEIVSSLNKEIDSLHNQVEDFVEDKKFHEKQIEEFAVEIDSRIEEWKSLLKKKNDEIKELKVRFETQHSKSSSDVFDDEAHKSQITSLNAAINNRDDTIHELQKQLKNATKEMEKSTELMCNLTSERDTNAHKVDKLNSLLKELKSQLKSSHNRCHELQEQVKFLENLSVKKDKDISNLLQIVKDNGQVELSAVLSKLHDLKMHKRHKEKQISDLVKTCNKLQNELDSIEKENFELRARLGITEDDPVCATSVTSKQRKQRKALQTLENKVKDLEEEKLTMRLEMQKLNRAISNLSNRLVELGDIPDFELSEQTVVEETVEKAQPAEMVLRSKHVEVVEENEALRKGLHEILQGLRSQSDANAREIKSETLEQLLRALDVKHVSGWYHPAMRLQAELHALQGINAELREQLRIARLDTHIYEKEKQPPSEPQLQIPTITSTANSEIISNLNEHLMKVLNEYHVLERSNDTMKNKLDKYHKDFQLIQQQIGLLYRQYNEEKSRWIDEKQEYVCKEETVFEKCEILEMKLNETMKFTSSDDEDKLKQILEVSTNVVTLNRKCLYLENENAKLLNKLQSTTNDLSKAETTTLSKINKLIVEKNHLLDTINVLKLHNDLQIDTKFRLDFDNLTMKHRNLLSDFHDIHTWKENQITTLNESIESLKDEKQELLNKLQDLIVKLNTFEVSSLEIDKAKETLSNKLAQSEINEITERQRANHTNNLYELVKEQLKKSEDRFKELETYNKELMRKNLTLQENIKDLEDKIVSDSNEVPHQYVELLEENGKLKRDYESLKIDFDELKSEKIPIQANARECEILDLKHQILDLQASTDDKALIARLSSDVIHARLAQAECQKKLENLTTQFELSESRYEDLSRRNELDLKDNVDMVVKLKNKISVLHDIVSKQREQYYGFVPLTSEQKFIENLVDLHRDKHSAFLNMQKSELAQKECEILKEQLRERIDDFKSSQNFSEKILNWCDEKCTLQLQELKHRRILEFTQRQFEEAVRRIELQERQLSKLEEELLVTYKNKGHFNQCEDVSLQPLQPVAIDCNVKIFKSEETQTIFERLDVSSDSVDASINGLQLELINTQNELSGKDKDLEQLKTKIVELEMNISLFRSQLGDKQSQITFYEKHIMDLQAKKDAEEEKLTNQEFAGLKATVSNLQLTLVQKEETILKYQALLKQDRDEHSLAAARMQEELKHLQNMLVSQQRAYNELQETKQEKRPDKIAIEHYIKQVHALDKHTSDLHTNVSTLESQLQCAREECVRWRSLANDRLQSMEDLRKNLVEIHRNELSVYKNECEKWRQEVTNLKILISKHREEPAEKDDCFEKAMKEKDDKIHELSVVLRQTRNEMKKKSETVESPKVYELEAAKEQITKEHDTLKKRFEQLLNREKSARDEIRNLKGQLMKRPVTSSRSDKTEVLKEQLQKKISGLEKEVDELKENLQKQMATNEAHRVKVADDFEKWNKQKYWQQTSEKLKAKLKEKTEELEKSQQTCSNYRVLIERLEREKHALENKNKMLRSGNPIGHVKLEMLEIENDKLHAELDALNAKLEMQQHHSGSLGATMLQEKLEGQERKIAILELSAKGTGELRAELERLHATNANLQKMNLRLEAENLEFKLDLEKSSKELPHLREQVQHLESYIEVLKSEGSDKHVVTSSGDHVSEPKKISELERTVFILKRIVEKLQVENKRLQGGKPCVMGSDRSVTDEQLRRDFHRLKEQYGNCVQKIARLEDELGNAKKIKSSTHDASVMEELSMVKDQLAQKAELLDKVKILLHRAAIKEKYLLDEISQLKTRASSE